MTTPYDPPIGQSCQAGGTLVTWADLNVFISPECQTQISKVSPRPTTSAQVQECKEKAGSSPPTTQVCSAADIDEYCTVSGTPGSREELSDVATCAGKCPLLGSSCPRAGSIDGVPYRGQCSDNTSWIFNGKENVCYLTHNNTSDEDICRNWLMSAYTLVPKSSRFGPQPEFPMYVNANTYLKSSLDPTEAADRCVDAAGRAEAAAPAEYKKNRCTIDVVANLCFQKDPTTKKPRRDTRCAGKDGLWAALNYPSCYQLPDTNHPTDPFHTDHRCYTNGSKAACLKQKPLGSCDWGGNTKESCANKIPDPKNAYHCVTHLKKPDCEHDDRCEWRIEPPTQGYTCWYDVSK